MNTQLIEKAVLDLLPFNFSKPLSSYVTFDKTKIKYTNIPQKQEGIYAFWLSNKDFDVINLNRSLLIKGAGDKDLSLQWDWNLNQENILVYVGKTTKFKKRLGQHLKLKTSEWVIPSNEKSPYKATSTCQLRTGIEHLLSGNPKIVNKGLTFMKNRIHVNFVPLEGFENRFFAEDLAIGKGKPWFNVDSER